MMANDEIKYRLYPSLLDRFQAYIDAEKEYEGPFNRNSYTGLYTLSLKEIEDKLEKQLLDAINRVPFTSPAVENGTVFNELVDCVHRGIDTRRKDIEFKSFPKRSLIAARYKHDDDTPDTVFLYDLPSVKAAAEFWKGSVCQLFVSGILPTAYGNTELYGFIDELKRDMVYDIKTTSRYTFGSYEGKWQRHVYPYCLIASNMVESVIGFEYSIIKWKSLGRLCLDYNDPLYEWINPNAQWTDMLGNPVTIADYDYDLGAAGLTPPPQLKPAVNSFDYYSEYYDYNHKESTERLQAIVEDFIVYLENNRDKITNKKIFNQQEDAA